MDPLEKYLIQSIEKESTLFDMKNPETSIYLMQKVTSLLIEAIQTYKIYGYWSEDAVNKVLGKFHLLKIKYFYVLFEQKSINYHGIICLFQTTITSKQRGMT